MSLHNRKESKVLIKERNSQSLSNITDDGNSISFSMMGIQNTFTTLLQHCRLQRE